MRYRLDTNILSNITKPEPSVALMTWMEEQTDEDLYIASQTVAEIHKGVLEKPTGKKRTSLKTGLSTTMGRSVILPIVSYPLTKRRLSYGRD